MKQSQKTVALWIVMILIFAVLFKLVDPGAKHRHELKFSEFLKAVKDKKVAEVTIKEDNSIVGVFKDPQPPDGKKYFETVGDPKNQKVIDLLDQQGVTFSY